MRRNIMNIIGELSLQISQQQSIDKRGLIEAMEMGLDMVLTASSTLRDVIEGRIVAMSTASVFVGMKWLILLHQTLSTTHKHEVVLFVQHLLSLMPMPTITDNFQQYFKSKLFNPYLKYLTKLSYLTQLKLCEPEEKPTPSDFTYFEFNLLIFTAMQFVTPLKQFSKFIKKQYPCLSKYVELLSKDVSVMFRNVQLVYQSDKISEIKFLQIERLGTNLELLKLKRESKLQKTSDTNDHISQYPKITNLSPIKLKNGSTVQDYEVSFANFKC